MFYSQFILAKKGPLGTIWIAAHLERKLRKNQVADTDIGVSVDSILFPDVPIALRLSSHLLLGVVRIYSRKVNYLFDDCSEALLKVKQAFRSTAVDLPPEESKAPYHSITLPETFELDDFELPDNDIIQGNYVDHHVSSREQITLQDPMDSVAYSTSKFGLDERFGDGDASGLDLEEELFLHNVPTTGVAGVSADAQVSVEPMTPLKHDELRDVLAANSESMVDGAEVDTDFVEYAHAPCTPGLAEEPNLLNIQETSACDEHLETEYQHPTASVMKGDLRNISEGDGGCDENSLPRHMPLPKDVLPDAVVDTHSEETCCHSRLAPEVSFECVPSNNHTSSSRISGNVDPVNAPLQELIDDALPDAVLDSHSEDNGSQLGVCQFPAPKIAFECVPSDKQTSVSRTSVHVDPVSTPLRELADDAVLDSHSEEAGYDLGVGQVPAHKAAFECVPLDKHTLESGASVHVDPGNAHLQELPDEAAKASHNPKEVEVIQNQMLNNDNVDISSHSGSHKDCLSHNGINSEEEACNIPGLASIDFSVPEDIIQGHRKSPVKHAPETYQEQRNSINLMTSGQFHILKPCNAHSQVDSSKPCGDHLETSKMQILCASEPSIVPGEMCPPTHDLKHISYENHMEVPTMCGDNEVSSQKSNVLVEDVALLEDVAVTPADCPQRNPCNSALPDIPAPEKLLSVPEGVVDLLVGVLAEDTPAESLRINDTGPSDSKFTSGRKRSYSESTLTKQSLNSFDSTRTVRSRTTELIPDDEDLLSSILAGKRSSTLKLKLTHEKTSVKRRRIAQSSVLKRKVLMDDTMVLHGDAIREQLTYTEDIRRVRKRAPCTCSEISVIQKQILEDKIFSEPILTGVSMELGCLHKQTFDLTKIKVLQNVRIATPVEEVTDPKQTFVNDENSKILEFQTVDKFDEPHTTRENEREGTDEPPVTGYDGNVNSVLAANLGENQNLTSDDNATQMLMDTTADVEANASQLAFSGNASETGIDQTNTSHDDVDNIALAGVEILSRENEREGTAEPSVTGDYGSINVALVTNNQDGSHNLTLNDSSTQIRMDTTADDSEANVSQLDSSGNAAETRSNQPNMSHEYAENTALAGVGILHLTDGALGVLAESNASHFELSDSAVETGTYQINVSLNAENTASAGIDFLHSTDGALDCLGDNSSGLHIKECDLSKVMDASAQIDESYISTNHIMGNQDVMTDMSTDEHNVDNPREDRMGTAEIENYPRAVDSVSLGVAQVDAEVVANDYEDFRIEYDSQVLTSNDICGEHPTIDSSWSAEVKVPVPDHTIDFRQIPSQQETYLQSLFDGEVSINELNDPDASNYSGALNDTGFLNDDDYDNDEEEDGAAGDYVLDAEGARLTDNSGWSSRTRAVAKYLQTVFTKETHYGRDALSLDSLLVGKTRKEACRMFFESLVLKTKDYVHVEQAFPFDDITVKPRMQLMKSEF
ncbi:unnamed protein product [Cuscuta campestris]|uniref:Rad21/Rec8-like protein N-terminal domain-containing protein n=1 Tax=Cuscuta campestris TaxID=132261 RepID=A0A484K9A0_9ASTE|nr:unnamed protein product [Cuscuta campestris]